MKKIVLFCLLLNACSLAPDYQRPDVAMPTAWKAENATADDVSQNWWTGFSSSELGDLIAKAQRDNTDLRAGLQRIEQARAQVKINRSYLVPSLGVDADASISDRDNNRSSLGAGINVAYEADLWKRIGNSAQSAQNTFNATRYDQDALALLVNSDTAQRYFELLSLRKQRDLTADTIKLYQDTLNIVQARFDEGAASGLELAQQKTVLANAQTSLADLDNQIAVAENALAILMGVPPQNAPTVTAKFDQLVAPFAAGSQPADLLQRRPDIAAAEERLKAANADIGVARAAVFPSLTISGSTSGLAAPASGSTVLTSGLTASVVATIFNAGRFQAQIDQATARQLELVENYRGTVLVAFREVEDALATIKAAQAQENSLNTALSESRNAYNIAQDRYLNGATNFADLLDTQRSLLQAEQSLIRARQSRLTALVDLYRALGGGWRVEILDAALAAKQ